MPTGTELLKSVLEAHGGDADNLPDNLESTLLKAISNQCDGSGGGGTSIDVTASVGQTIIVKEVDANGKPTKWESAEYQPRTHWSGYEETVLIDNQSYGEYDEVFLDFALVAGQSYHIVFNGVEYDEVARSGNTNGVDYVVLGNGEMFGEESTGEPYTFIYIEGQGTMPMTNVGGDYTVSLSTVQETVYKIPNKYIVDDLYLPFRFTVFRDSEGTDNAMITVFRLEAEYAKGRQIIATMRIGEDVVYYLPMYGELGSNTYGKVLAFAAASSEMLLIPQEDGTYLCEIKTDSAT